MRRIIVILILLSIFTAPVFAAGLMHAKGNPGQALQIAEHHVKVTINNGFAVTEVDQTFRNPQDRDLEAFYTFPIPRDAALSEVNLFIDGVEQVGEVVPRKKAREIYNAERDAGRETALGEQRGYTNFDLAVGRVPAGGDVRLRLVYLQAVDVDTGIGRYVYPLEEGRIDEKMLSFWEQRTEVHDSFTFEAIVRSAYPLDAVRLNGRTGAEVKQVAPDEWRVWLDSEEGGGNLDKDIVLYYRLAEGVPARIDLLAYRAGQEPGTMMLVVTPGADLQEIREGVDWTFVVDLSGSMAHKLPAVLDAISQSLDQLRVEDRFRIVGFSNRSHWVVKDYIAANEENVSQARALVLGMASNGGTNLFSGVERGLSRLDEDRSSAMLLIGDGGANEGPTEIKAFLNLLADHDVRVFTFVVGQGANRPLLETLAETSGGFSMAVSNEDDLYGRILQAREKLGREALHGLEIELNGAKLTQRAPVHLPNAYYGQQIVFFARYDKPGEAELVIRSKISGEEQKVKTRITLPEHDESYPELERLWAFARIKDLLRDDERGLAERNAEKVVTELGVEYSLVTPYTSMVVVREEQFEEHGIDRRNARRSAKENKARTARTAQPVRSPRADTQQPAYGGRSAPRTGSGAAGPAMLMLVGLLGGARALSRRKKLAEKNKRSAKGTGS